MARQQIPRHPEFARRLPSAHRAFRDRACGSSDLGLSCPTRL